MAALLDAIAADDAAFPAAETSVLLLGDLVDRGPHSREVVERARILSQQPGYRVLGGNHEDMFLLAFRKEGALRSFLRYGGRETLLSYGIDRQELREGTLAQVQERMKALVPADHRTFLAGLEDSVEIGDYLFVHAGIDPARNVADQRRQDLRWIREPFLDHSEPLARMIVHGHTIHAAPEFHPHRIGIDTGAYSSGRLTAIGLEARERWFIEAALP